jgi:hypothetical protein
MRASFLLLAGSDLALLGLTAVLGLLVSGVEGFSRHFLLGVLSGLYTCFVHVVLFMYFVVQDKIVKESVLHHGLSAAFAGRVEVLKSRALRLSVAGIFSILATTSLGAAVGIAVPPEAHLVAAFAAMAINGWVFVGQYGLVERCQAMFREAFGPG